MALNYSDKLTPIRSLTDKLSSSANYLLGLKSANPNTVGNAVYVDFNSTILQSIATLDNYLPSYELKSGILTFSALQKYVTQHISTNKGSQGPRGPQGYRGLQGLRGKAIQGIQGLQGPKGEGGKSPDATQGIQGIQGSAGTPTQGYRGNQGRAIGLYEVVEKEEAGFGTPTKVKVRQLVSYPSSFSMDEEGTPVSNKTYRNVIDQLKKLLGVISSDSSPVKFDSGIRFYITKSAYVQYAQYI